MNDLITNELGVRVDPSKQLELERELHARTKTQLSEMTEYADKLAQGLPCLPKDVEILREANAGLAQENHELAQAMLQGIVGLLRAYSKFASLQPDQVYKYIKKEL
jgi:hypothetical protein